MLLCNFNEMLLTLQITRKIPALWTTIFPYTPVPSLTPIPKYHVLKVLLFCLPAWILLKIGTK